MNKEKFIRMFFFFSFVLCITMATAGCAGQAGRTPSPVNEFAGSEQGPPITTTVLPSSDEIIATVKVDENEPRTAIKPIEIGAQSLRPFALASEGPVINAGDGGDLFHALQNSGAVTYYDGQFHMFRNGYPTLPGNAVIGYSTSTDGIHWIHYGGNPVFGSADVPYADQMIMASSVHVENGGRWVMYFLIWDSPETPAAIGRATAQGPTGPWIPDPKPVLFPGGQAAWDSAGVTQPIVIVDEQGDDYLMYYTGLDENGLERIGMAFSSDGTSWDKYDDPETIEVGFTESDPVLQPGSPEDWDGRGAARGRVVKTEDGFTMIYRTPSTGLGFNYGLAFSDDGINWQKADANPILEGSDIPGVRGLFFPTFVYFEGIFYFFIEGYRGVSSIYLLTAEAPLILPKTDDLQMNSAVSDLSVNDISNQGNASDIEVSIENHEGIETALERRILLLKAENFSIPDEQSIRDLPEGCSALLNESGERIKFRLPESLLDIDGDAVVEGRSYIILFVSMTSGGEVQYETTEEFTLVNEAAVHTLIPELPSATGGLAVDGEGILYAANIGRAPARNGSEIYRITPDGQVELWVEGQGIQGASGNAFDSQGNLIQSSLRANTIHRIGPDGTVTEIIREGIRSPVGIVISADGRMFVANCGSNSIQMVTPEGESMAFASDPLLSCPNGITLDDSGNVYVANFNNGDVIKISPAGIATKFATLPGHNNGHIIYLNGELYVVSRSGHQIFTLTTEGGRSLLAGSGERGHQDGSARKATFSLPNDIAPSPDGQRLYVNEALPTSGSSNQPSVIRIIELPRDPSD